MKSFAVIGRVLFDDEDSIITMQAPDADAAATEFRKKLREDRSDIDPKDEILITAVLWSDSGIIEVERCV